MALKGGTRYRDTCACIKEGDTSSRVARHKCAVPQHSDAPYDRVLLSILQHSQARPQLASRDVPDCRRRIAETTQQIRIMPGVVVIVVRVI